MKRSKRSRTSGELPFVDPLFDEQLNSRRRTGRSRPGRHASHKTMQLCRQVQRALSLSLGDCHDDVLQSLYVDAVAPAPDASRLLVRLIVPKAVEVSAAEILARLERVEPKLRADVASAITRKRAPELTFLPLPDGVGEVSP